jgi:hypothetical protein
MTFSFDVISDLYITDHKNFDWENKPTSLYCLVPGNVTNDIYVLYSILKNLSKYYQGVFYIDGSFEHTFINEKEMVNSEIAKVCSKIKNVVYLHNNVVVVDGIALLGINGWHNNMTVDTADDHFQIKSYKYDDLLYLEKTIEKLQLHVDVKKIIVLSNSVPIDKLCLGETSTNDNDVDLSMVLAADTEKKIITWIFGHYKKIVDTNIDGINYLNNPCYDRNPYYAKRINIAI